VSQPLGDQESFGSSEKVQARVSSPKLHQCAYGPVMHEMNLKNRD